MKQISQEEFEQCVRDMINGKCTRKDLERKYHVDKVILNNKIQELYVSNLPLYMQFIEKFPYRPRTYTHINYRAMVIDIMKREYTKFQAEEAYGISSRTIARKIISLEQSDPELVYLYRQVAKYRKSQQPLPTDLQQMVDELQDEEIFVGNITDKREEELLEREKSYNATRMAGISDSKAYGTRKAIKDLSTLYRIKIEKNAREQMGQSETISKVNETDEREER